MMKNPFGGGGGTQLQFFGPRDVLSSHRPVLVLDLAAPLLVQRAPHGTMTSSPPFFAAPLRFTA